ncbi:2306_t:CDS:2 [Ambispora gerdemannii]|uniref:2306_t:CDS:1 n=1 Tax=Ambispora gerdemannii TaxID=144530 RepID=A0A9N9F8F0_9GLOM|nr:2306_t:CDS:2 [Ambispora gerdemannii]
MEKGEAGMNSIRILERPSAKKVAEPYPPPFTSMLSHQSCSAPIIHT